MSMTTFLNGAVVMGYAVIGLFFCKFWKETGDRLFLFFSAAFWVLLVHQLLLANVPIAGEHLPMYYGIRLFGYVLIIIGFLDKNRPRH
jgi:hypothetical protein